MDKIFMLIVSFTIGGCSLNKKTAEPGSLMLKGDEIAVSLLSPSSLQLSKIINGSSSQANVLHKAIVKQKWVEGIRLAKAQLKVQPFKKD